VFVFVPVYIDKKSDATVRPTIPGPLAKFRCVFFRQDRRLQPFWTWFIDNPRPPIAEMKTMLQSIRIYIVITLLTGIVYPLAMTGVVQILFLLDQVQQP
jgi:hypothetical protein